MQAERQKVSVPPPLDSFLRWRDVRAARLSNARIFSGAAFEPRHIVNNRRVGEMRHLKN